MLLSDTTHDQSSGKVSFADLKSINGVEYGSYKDACRALGLLEDDLLWYSVMEDAKLLKLPRQIRDLFVMIMVFTEVSDPKRFFDDFYECMTEDYEVQLIPPDSTNKDLIRNMLLIDIDEQLQSTGNAVLFKV